MMKIENETEWVIFFFLLVLLLPVLVVCGVYKFRN